MSWQLNKIFLFSIKNKKTTCILKKYRLSFFITFCTTFLILGNSPALQAQNSELEMGLINVGISSVIGGVGALINKDKEEKPLKVLLKGMSQGALGGYVIFESKRLVRAFGRTENYNYVWPSKLMNSAGTSILENAARNQDFWVQWHINIGFTRLDIYVQDKLRLKYRIMPFSLYGAIRIWHGNKVDWDKTLKLGTMVFIMEELNDEGIPLRGAQLYNHIALRKRGAILETEAHELVHVYQNDQFSGFNSFAFKFSTLGNSKYKIFRVYNKYFYTDFNSQLFTWISTFEKNNSGSIQENYFENEAYHFSD